MQTDAMARFSALNRFGLGAGPQQAPPDDPQAWLLAQSRAPADDLHAFDGFWDSLAYLRQEADFVGERRSARRAARAGDTAEPDSVRGLYKDMFGERLRAEFLARWRIAAATPTPFQERLVRFWSNHFAVSVDKNPARLYAAPMEREAIRPHVNGRFADMLVAVESHPAMLRYLDQDRSVGADSMAATRQRFRRERNPDAPPGRAPGLNENLAREILELHTLGAQGGYTQDDVVEFARALTGWSMPGPAQVERGMVFESAYLFRENTHEPGPRVVLGRRYPEAGAEQARTVMVDLAVHPATAHHLALKLARHFVADDPPPALVREMETAYLQSGGELSALYGALVRSGHAWDATARKFRTPQDLVCAVMRAGSLDPGDRLPLWEGALARLGHPTFRPRSPAGFDDRASDWIAPDALWKRIQVAEAFAQRVPRAVGDPPPPLRAAAALGPRLDDDTARAVARAEAPQQAMALLFASPAFQWRA